MMTDMNGVRGLTDFVLIPDHQTTSRSRLQLSQAGDQNKNVNKWCLKKIFRKKLLYRHVPIVTWLPRYSGADAVGDVIAGITVALAAIPLALAFAGIAALPTEFALYSSFMGNIVYTVFGSCKDNIFGSTAIASLLTLQAANGVWQKAVLFTLLSGLVELLMGLGRLGFVIDFVSGPVSAGFTSAVALIIFTSQIKNILVVKSTGNSFLENWITMLRDIRNYHLPDTLLGVGSIVVLLLLRLVGSLRVGSKGDSKPGRAVKVLNKILWFLGVGRNALLVFVTAGVVAHLESRGLNYFQLTGFIPSGFPKVEVPAFSLPATPANATAGIAAKEVESFLQLVKEFGSCLIVIPLIALLETIAVCKTFANGKPVDTNQELITLGLANIANSFFRGYRINGGLARGSVNTASGGRTPFVNVYVAGIVILALIYLAEYFYFIPKATLAGIIIAAVLFQLQYQVVIPMWRSKKSDLIPGFVAFIACLVLPLGLGVSIAIGVNLLFIMYHSARPEISVDALQTPSGKAFLKLTPDRCLVFPSVEFVRNHVLKMSIKFPLPVVFDCTYIYGTDFTTAKVLESIIADFARRKQKLIFFNLRPSVAHVFETLHEKITICYTMECIEKELDDIPAATTSEDTRL